MTYVIEGPCFGAFFRGGQFTRILIAVRLLDNFVNNSVLHHQRLVAAEENNPIRRRIHPRKNFSRVWVADLDRKSVV